MIYTVVIMGASREQNLVDALSGQVKTRHVYVVGMEEGSVLANALAGKDVAEIADPSAEDVMQFSYSEIIGMEDEHCIAKAKRRAAQLQNEHPSPLARSVIGYHRGRPVHYNS